MLHTPVKHTIRRFSNTELPLITTRKHPVLAIALLVWVSLFCIKELKEKQHAFFIKHFFCTRFKYQEIKTKFSSQEMFQKIKNTSFAPYTRKQAMPKESLLPELGFLFHKWRAMAW